MTCPYVFLMTHILYLVPTPLGDSDDITLRALRILREARAIASDQRADTHALMDRYSITTPILAYAEALAALEIGDVALVAGSGTPGIGGAAHEIVAEAIVRGIQVVPLPGASAPITALVLSGLPTDAFVYIGALPDDLSAYAHERETMIFATDDVIPALERLIPALGDRAICAAARLTQPDEIVYRGMISGVLADLRGRSAGAFTLIVAGAPPEIAPAWDEARVRASLRERLQAGEPLKQAAKSVAAAAGWDRRAVYALGIDEKRP